MNSYNLLVNEFTNLSVINVYIIELIINRTINEMTYIHDINIEWIIKIYFDLL